MTIDGGAGTSREIKERPTHEEEAVRESYQGPVGRVEIVEAGPDNVPHVVTQIHVTGNEVEQHVSFRGPCLPGQSPEYMVFGGRNDVASQIRNALEARMYPTPGRDMLYTGTAGDD